MLLSAGVEQQLRKTQRRASVPCSNFKYVRHIDIAGRSTEATFRAVKHGVMLEAASELLNDRYGWRGYGATHSIPLGVHHTTFTAEVNGGVVGTITLAIDSNHGLAIDQTFADEAKEIRDTKASNICELIRLAFNPEVRSQELMANLFHFTFIVGTSISDCTDLLIEVAPRHTVFYKTMLGFEKIGALKTNTSVGSPSQLMRLKVDTIRGNIVGSAAGKQQNSSRSLYTQFLSHAEELGVRRALMASQKRVGVNLDQRREQARHRDLGGASARAPSHAAGPAIPAETSQAA